MLPPPPTYLSTDIYSQCITARDCVDTLREAT